jgi:hypothetical protein
VLNNSKRGPGAAATARGLAQEVKAPMQQEGSRTVVEADTETDRAVLAVLLNEGPQLWSVDELVRTIGNTIEVQDSLARLYGAGLLHRLEGFVLASRAARRALELSG